MHQRRLVNLSLTFALQSCRRLIGERTTMLRSFVVVLMIASVLLVAPARSVAQNQDPKLSEIVPHLYRDAILAEIGAFLTVIPESVDADY